MKKVHVFIVIILGLFAISSSSILTRLCSAPVLIISLYRVGIASALYTLLLAGQKKSVLAPYQGRQLWLAAAAGLALSLHFLTWIESLSHTSIASSVVLVTTSPVWVALGSFLFLKEKPGKLMWLGILVTFAGGVIISGADFQLTGQHLYGDLLAVAGAIFAAIYLLVGRNLRAGIDTLPYVSVVYGFSALLTLIFALFSKTPVFQYDLTTFILLFSIALFPQMVGHTTLNWALKYVSATAVAIMTLSEPVGASILAWIILGERISLIQFMGALVTLGGISIAIFSERKK